MEQNNDHAKNTEKFIRMTTQPVEKLIAKLAVPTIISMLVTSFYNLADTFFVRQLENDSMVAAVGVVLPLMTLIQAFGFFCGHGSGNYISRAYGKQDYKDAETMAATGFCYAVLFGLIIGVLGLVFIDPLALLLGAKTEATIRSTIDYMRYILYATPFMTGAIVMNNQLRMQGNAFFAMIGLTSGAIVNIVLGPHPHLLSGRHTGGRKRYNAVWRRYGSRRSCSCHCCQPDTQLFHFIHRRHKKRQYKDTSEKLLSETLLHKKYSARRTSITWTSGSFKHRGSLS